MTYQESMPITLSVNDYPNIFVYLLLNNNNVVYVGQTVVGLSRVTTHFNSNKKFNSIKIQPCNLQNVDILEDKLILKYKPIYNQRFNGSYVYSLSKVKRLLKNEIHEITLTCIKKKINELNISLITDFEMFSITKDDFINLRNSLKEEEINNVTR